MTDQAPAPYAGPKRVLSGVQPTGDLHLGNYLGALVKFARLQHRIGVEPDAGAFLVLAGLVLELGHPV
ncbi:MAG: hypothetical protein ACHP7A_01720, partial [Caulobacterales bacterium]